VGGVLTGHPAGAAPKVVQAGKGSRHDLSPATCRGKAEKRRSRRRNGQRLAARACETPAKVAYPDASEALAAASTISAATKRRLWPYPCRCGKWHLTSRKIQRAYLARVKSL
jgi:hypothetical protein